MVGFFKDDERFLLLKIVPHSKWDLFAFSNVAWSDLISYIIHYPPILSLLVDLEVHQCILQSIIPATSPVLCGVESPVQRLGGCTLLAASHRWPVNAGKVETGVDLGRD